MTVQTTRRAEKVEGLGRIMEVMSVAVGCKRPIPVFAPHVQVRPDGTVLEGRVLFIPLSLAAKKLGHRNSQALHKAICRMRVPFSELRQLPLLDGCRIFISERCVEEYRLTKAFKKGRPRKVTQ